MYGVEHGRVGVVEVAVVHVGTTQGQETFKTVQLPVLAGVFKPGDVVGVRGGSGTAVVVQSVATVRGDTGWPYTGWPYTGWPVSTTAGVFDETQLYQADPTVLETASGVDVQLRLFRSWSAGLRARGAAVERAPMEVRQRLWEVVRRLPLDTNGHFRSGRDLFRGAEDPLRVFPTDVTSGDAQELLLLPLGQRLPGYVYLGEALGSVECTCCGAEGFQLESDGAVVRVREPCRYPDGLPAFEWELNCPSGQLVVGYLKDLFPSATRSNWVSSYTLRGYKEATLAYAGVGLASAYVECQADPCGYPSVYQFPDGHCEVSHRRAESGPFDGEEVAVLGEGWYDMCDGAEFERRRVHFSASADFDVDAVVSVVPGVYRFSHQSNPSGRTWTRIEWVRPPDPEVDHLGRYLAATATAYQYVRWCLEAYPELYGTERRTGRATPWGDMTPEERVDCWCAVADYVFQGGRDIWHENGFPRAPVDPDLPDLPPPPFRRQLPWSVPGVGDFGAPMNGSFARLALRQLESIVSFGVPVLEQSGFRYVEDARRGMLVAVQAYRRLAALHPDEADPEYVRWFAEEGRAERWVRDFDLGPERTPAADSVV